ncbi:MAG: hypothetical protein EBZ48_14600 [Proteobacteria bacterium]|nr:hypothetical protein [Pseudomonadota bacterium]
MRFRLGLWVMGVLLAWGAASGAMAQSEPLLDDANDRANQAVSAVTLFTSQDTLSSGLFKFRPSNESSTEFRVTRLPYSHSFEPLSNGIVPEVSAVYGFSKLTQSPQLPAEAEGIDDFSRVSTNSIGVGGGLTIPAWVDGFSVAPRFFFAWSHLKRRYDFNNSYSQGTLKPFDEDFFNTYVDVLVYTPSVELKYDQRMFGATEVSVHCRYSQLFNDSVRTKSSVIDISSATGLLQSEIEAMVPTEVNLYGRDMKVHPFLGRSDIYGAARAGLGFSYFHEVGLDLVFTKPTDTSIFKDLSVGFSYSFGDSFDGWRLGVGLGV